MFSKKEYMTKICVCQQKNPFRLKTKGISSSLTYVSLKKMSYLSLIFCQIYVQKTRKKNLMKKNVHGLSLKKIFCRGWKKNRSLIHQFGFVSHQCNQTFLFSLFCLRNMGDIWQKCLGCNRL